MTDSEHIRAMLERVLHMQGSQAVEIGQMHGKIAKLYELVERVANDQLRRASLCAQHAKALADNAHAIQSIARAPAPTAPPAGMSASDITGPHDLAVLAAEHRELVESRKWWRQETAKWVAAIAAALLVAAVSGCTTYVVSHLK
jgi:hypothetical protein